MQDVRGCSPVPLPASDWFSRLKSSHFLCFFLLLARLVITFNSCRALSLWHCDVVPIGLSIKPTNSFSQTDSESCQLPIQKKHNLWFITCLHRDKGTTRIKKMWSVNSAPVSSLLDDKFLAGQTCPPCRPKMPSDVMKKATSLGQNAKRQQHCGQNAVKTHVLQGVHVLFLWHGHNTIQLCCNSQLFSTSPQFFYGRLQFQFSWQFQLCS